MEDRSKRFAVGAVGLQRKFVARPELWDVARQLARAATSTGANHRAMRRARSLREFAAKLQIVCEEIDESTYWLDLIAELAPDLSDDISGLHREALELRAIFAKARSTTRRKLQDAP